MNKEQTLKAVEVMKAYAEGKPIEYKGALDDEVWMSLSEPVWDWYHFVYRVKRVPVKLWVWYNPNPPQHLKHVIGADSNDAYWKDKGYTMIKVREVQD